VLRKDPRRAGEGSLFVCLEARQVDNIDRHAIEFIYNSAGVTNNLRIPHLKFQLKFQDASGMTHSNDLIFLKKCSTLSAVDVNEE